MNKKTIKYSLFLILAAALLLFTACQKKEEPHEISESDAAPTQDKKPQEIIIKSDDVLLDEESDKVPEDSSRSDMQAAPSDATPAAIVLEDLNAQIQAAIAPIQANGSNASVYAEQLSTGSYASVGSQPMQAASLIKLFIAGCVYEQLETVQALETYPGETDELLRTMITVSDNDAANTLATRLGFGDAAAGMALVNQFCQVHGFTDTHMGRLLLAPNDLDDNYTSVNDCGRFLKAVYLNEIHGAESILNLMKQQERTEKIPAGVPAGIVTANKTGELADVENDAAIIFGEKETYVVCVMMDGLADTYTARSTITSLSTQIYQYMNQ